MMPLLDRLPLLTIEEKAETIAAWKVTQDEFAVLARTGMASGSNLHDAVEMAGGRGYPDPAIYGLVERLNDIPGVVVVQSCSGHPQGPLQEYEHETRWELSGNLWLRVSAERFELVLERAHTFVDLFTIESVSILWGRHERGPVVDVTFHGLNKSEVALKEATTVIPRMLMLD